jgi:hypothetical protein
VSDISLDCSPTSRLPLPPAGRAGLWERAGLLILDNVDSEEAAAAVDELVGRLAGGHVLLTGRLARWGAEVEPLPLDVLAEGAAVEFLLERTSRGRRPTAEDGALAGELAREVGFLPLALEQAGAAIAERGLTFAGYLAEWRKRREVVLGWFDPRVSHYPASVAVTWQTSVDRLVTNQLGLLFFAKARYAEAEPLLHRALAIDEKSVGPEHPDVAIRLNNRTARFSRGSRAVSAVAAA